MTRHFLGGPFDGRIVEGDDVPAMGEIGLNQFAPYLLNMVAGQWNLIMAEELKAFDTTTPIMRTLAVLHLKSALTINELAAMTVTEQSTMSRTLDVMEDMDVIRRQPRPTDMRVREVHITEKGRNAFADIWPVMYGRFAQMFSGVSTEEYSAFVATLRKLSANLQD